MDEWNCTSELARFRQGLYQNFNKRADTLMELVDALSSNPSARSPVELTLTPCFRRNHTALYKALAEWRWSERQTAQLLAPHLPRPRSRHYWLLGVDVTPHPRRFATTLDDRGIA